MLTNDNFFKGVMGITEQWRFTEESVNLAMMPMFHIAGAGWSLVDASAARRSCCGTSIRPRSCG